MRRAACGTSVVHHDPVVPGLGPVHQLRYEELPSWVPTLGRVLAACHSAAVDVEIKNDPREPAYDPSQSVAADVLAALSGTGRPGPASAPSRVVVSSFSAAIVAALVSAGTGVPVGLLVSPGSDAFTALGQAAALGCSALHTFHLDVTPQLVVEAHGVGMAIVAWTVNDPRRAWLWPRPASTQSCPTTCSRSCVPCM